MAVKHTVGNNRQQNQKKSTEEYLEWDYQGEEKALGMREYQKYKTEKIPLDIVQKHRSRKEQKKTK